jgi:hypothetical protein
MNAENSPEKRSRAGSAAILERLAAAAQWLSRVVGEHLRRAARAVRERLLGLVTVAAIAAAALLAAAEFVDLYRIVTPAGELVAGANATRIGGDHHSYALLVIALTVLAATIAARWTAQPLLAIAVAALGALALAIVLIGDLPDVTSSGLTRGPLEPAEADPAVGFWLELAGATLTLAAGLALARLLTLARAGGPALGRTNPDT